MVLSIPLYLFQIFLFVEAEIAQYQIRHFPAELVELVLGFKSALVSSVFRYTHFSHHELSPPTRGGD
jgi:hypothetical protein